jgi:hypothetical protein
MADLKISALTSAGALAGTEPLPIVQGGSTKKTTAQDIANLKATPNLQQVTNVGFGTTNRLVSSDGAGSITEIGNGYIQIATGNIGDVNINASLVTASYVAKLPDKPTSPQTFAMMSDITSGVATVTAGTNISVTGTSTNPIINSLADRYKTSSLTSVLIGNGSKTFTVDANLAYIPLQEVLIVYDPSNHMHGTVTSYSGTTLVVDVNHHTGGGTFASWVINLDGIPIDAITGVGTANEISYFTSGQVIASLPVATYPSLTELSYVKGVTSAIQTQLNSKQAKTISNCADGTAIIGVTTIQYSKGLLIPANSRGANDAPQIEVTALKTGGAGNVTIRMYWNTTNDITTGSPILLGTFGPNAANSMAMVRVLMIQVANGSGNATRTAIATGTSAIGWVAGGAAASTLAINWTIDGYLICAVQNTSTADSTVGVMVKLN